MTALIDLRVNVVRALSVSRVSATTTRLRYPKLEAELQRVSERMLHVRALLPQEKTALGRELLQEQITSYELIETAAQLQRTHSPDEETRLSQRFTQLSTELYGAPTTRLAHLLATKELERFAKLHDAASLQDRRTLEAMYALLQQPSPPDGADETPETLSAHLEDEARSIASLIASIIRSRFAEAFAAIPRHQNSFMAPEIAAVFESILRVLAAKDSAWQEWVVARTPASKLSVDGGKQTVNIGLYRQAVTRVELEGLVAHELLVHALRSVNGSKSHGHALVGGLPGYHASEEGLATLFEFAMTDRIPQKIFDRYLDIALALHGVTRRQLLSLVVARLKLRARLEGQPIDETVLSVIAWAHANRIYRGTRGGDVVGVFTKDVVYYNGFVAIVHYLHDELQAGTSMDQLMQLLLAGKFDPTSAQQRAYVQAHDSLSFPAVDAR